MRGEREREGEMKREREREGEIKREKERERETTSTLTDSIWEKKNADYA